MIELLVLMLIVATVAVAAVPRLTPLAERQRVSQAVRRLEAIRQAEAMHYSLHGSYTESVPALAVEVPEVDDGIIGTGDGQWEYTVTVSGGAPPSYVVSATRVAGKGMPGSLVWDSATGAWSGTHPLRPR